VKNVLICGIGSVLLGDDGVGPYVARLLAARYQFDPGVEVVDLGTPALALVDQLSGRDAVIVIDSVDTQAAPGTVLLYRKPDIMRCRTAVRLDPHSPALVDALHATEVLAVAPAEVLLVGIQAASFDAGCALSGPVSRSVENALIEVLRELDRLGVGHRLREQEEEADIWWAQSGTETDMCARSDVPQPTT
jgi:hydrogenase maturation protease